jgi:hypothetical protein
MADGFGFRFDADAAGPPVPILLHPQGEQPPQPVVQAGLGAGRPETWWGELVEFASPFLACVGLAVLTASLAPGGWALMGVGFRL